VVIWFAPASTLFQIVALAAASYGLLTAAACLVAPGTSVLQTSLSLKSATWNSWSQISLQLGWTFY
jgi:hypothetical protein